MIDLLKIVSNLCRVEEHIVAKTTNVKTGSFHRKKSGGKRPGRVPAEHRLAGGARASARSRGDPGGGRPRFPDLRELEGTQVPGSGHALREDRDG